jgi:hypothetical protein
MSNIRRLPIGYGSRHLLQDARLLFACEDVGLHHLEVGVQLLHLTLLVEEPILRRTERIADHAKSAHFPTI